MRINVFNTKSNFLSKLNSSVISNEDISFIKDTKEIYTGGEFWQSGSSSSSIEIDSELNISSKNPVQNAVVTDAINKIQSVATEAKNNTTTLASSIENKVSQEEYNNKISEIESKINECATDKIIRILCLPEDGSDGLTDEQKAYNAETYQMLLENNVIVGWSGGIFTIGDYMATGEPITLTAKFVMNNNILGGMFLSVNVLLSSDGIVTPDEESIIECPMLCILNTPDWAAIYFNKGRYFSELRPCIVNPWSQMICYVDTIHASAPIVEYNLYDKRYRVTFDDSTYEIISTEEIQFGGSGGGSGNYLEVRELKMNDDMTVTEEHKAYNIETYNKAQAGEAFALSSGGFVFDLAAVRSDTVLFSSVAPYPFDNRKLASISIALFAGGTFNISELDFWTVDTAMNAESENAVQNKVVKKYIDDAIANAEIGGGDIDTSNFATKEELNTKQDGINDLDTIRSGAALGATALQSVPSEYVTDVELNNKGYATMLALSDKVDKVSGKQLSTEDFTPALKKKLEELNNYDNTEIENAITSLQTQFNTLVSGNASDAINSFNEIIAFLDGVKDTEDLSSIITSIEQQIAGKMDKVTLAAVATSGSYNDLSNKPTIPSAVTESTVSGWGFTKNTGTYSKPSTGIPKIDLASDVQASLGKADTALQSEEYKGTVTGVKINGDTKNPSSGVVDLGTVITSHQDISGKADTDSLATVATSGSYNDLLDKPTIPTETIVDSALSTTSTNPVQNKAVTTALADKVDKVTGKGLSTSDYTPAEKNKLAGIAEGANVNVQSDWNATNGDAYIKNKPTIPSAVTESTVSDWGFTKNTGTYSKPSGGIPKSDLSSTVQESLNKADSALQSYTEQYTGTVTGVKINGTTNNPSNGVVDLGTVSVPTPVVSISTTSQSIEPNKYYKWSSARSSLTITLATPKDTSILNNYMFEFPTSTSGCTLSVPSGIKWAHGEVPVFEPSVTYQISIINNLAVVTKFA